MRLKAKPLSGLYCALALWWFVSAVHAKPDPNQCRSIRDHSERTACMAESKSKASVGDCAGARGDRRRTCEARVSGREQSCHAIRNATERRKCFAGVGW